MKKHHSVKLLAGILVSVILVFDLVLGVIYVDRHSKLHFYTVTDDVIDAGELESGSTMLSDSEYGVKYVTEGYVDDNGIATNFGNDWLFRDAESDEDVDDDADADDTDDSDSTTSDDSSSSSGAYATYKSSKQAKFDKYDEKAAEIAAEEAAEEAAQAEQDKIAQQEAIAKQEAAGRAAKAEAARKAAEEAAEKAAEEAAANSSSTSNSTTSTSSSGRTISISSAQVYGIGDSIMYGTGNYQTGVVDFLSADGATALYDISTPGAYMCGVGNSDSLPAISTTQYGKLQAAITINGGVNENTVIVMDGGGNDLFKYCAEQAAGTSTTGITVSGGSSENTDIALATRALLSNTCSYVGNYDTSKSYKVPIFFVIASYQSSLSGGNAAFQDTWDSWAKTIKSICSEYADYGVIVIDENSLLETADFTDCVHPNASGYNKINAAIESKLKSGF